MVKYTRLTIGFPIKGELAEEVAERRTLHV